MFTRLRTLAPILIAATSFLPMRLTAQDTTTTPSGLCYRGRPAPACRHFVLTEIGFYRVAAVSKSRFSFPYLDGNGNTVVGSYSEDDMGSQLSWEVGLMANRGRHTALGATIMLGVGDGGGDVGIKGRYRRWFTPNEVSFDVGAGVISGGMNAAQDGGRTGGITGDVALNAGDYGAVVVRGDMLRVRGHTGTAIYGGVRLGSKPALAGTALVAAGFVVLLALLSRGFD